MSHRTPTDEPLTIGLVLDDSLDTTDGVQQYVLTIGRWLAAQGHAVHYLVGQTRRQDIPNLHSLTRNIRVRFNGNILTIPLPASTRRLRQLLREYDFDVLHVQTPYSPFLAGKLIRLASPKTAIVGTFHILAYDRWVSLANRALAVLNRRTASRFDLMIANSAPSAAFAQEIYGFDSRIIPNPFDLQQFEHLSAARHTEFPRIVFLGRLVPRKGAQWLLRAIAYIQENRLYEREYKVIIGGKGPMADDLYSFVMAHELMETVSLPGFVPESDKAAFLAQADIAVFPSTAGESFGISLLEGLTASNGVVLAGDNPGYRAVIGPLSEQQLFDPRETKSFAELLAHWLSATEQRQAVVAGQRAYARQFDVPVIGEQVLSVFNEALRQRRNMR